MAGRGARPLMAARRRASARRISGGRPGVAGFHGQRDRRTDRRGGADRPAGGLADLAARRLRMAGPRAFAEDPLRVLRLARVAVELGLEPEPQTTRSAHAQAEGLRRVSAERVFMELRRIIAAPEALAGAGADGRAGGDGGGAARAGGAARRGAEPLPSPRRLRPHTGGARPDDRADHGLRAGCPRPGWRRRPARAGGGRAAGGAARGRAHPRGRAPLGGSAARRRQAPHPGDSPRGRARDVHRPRHHVAPSWPERCWSVCGRASGCAPTSRRWPATTCGSAFSSTSPSRWRAGPCSATCAPARRSRWT